MNPDQTHSRKTDMDIEWTKLKTYKNKKQHFIPHLRYRCEKIFKERHGINPWIYQSKRRQQFKIYTERKSNRKKISQEGGTAF